MRNEISKEEWEYLYNAFKDKEEVSWKFALGASKEEGRVEGKEEGRVEGREEERQESVKKMASLLKKMGLSLDDCLLNIKEEYSPVDPSIIESIVKEVFE